MTPEKIAYFKDRLLQELQRLNQQIQDLGEENPNQPGRFNVRYPESGSNSEDDNAAEITEYTDEQSIMARAADELKDVEDAIKAVENGNYGVCKYCKSEIDEKRLEARPASSSCIKCKKLFTQEL
ncbi:MAG: hypothetical protein RDU25_06175 [Patescibacteria group bacterium]|nr:hypothetical protein [Patescibacteria group bacterium]